MPNKEKTTQRPSGDAYRFCVAWKEDTNVVREIVILGSQNFEDLHNAIQDAFGFDKSQMASFYLCKEGWKKGREITLVDMNDEIAPPMKVSVMRNTLISQVIPSAADKLIYIFDFLNMWVFHMEFKGTGKPKMGMRYPVCVHRAGEAPEQYAREEEDDDEDSDEYTETGEELMDEHWEEGVDDEHG